MPDMNGIQKRILYKCIIENLLKFSSYYPIYTINHLKEVKKMRFTNKEKKHSCLQIKGVPENKIYICLLCILVVSFSLLYFDRFAPDTMGWQLYNSILMKNGKMVYRDFFNYIPPGSLFRTIWAYTLTNGSILGYRFICILERVLLAFLVFKILSRFYETRYTWIATVIGTILSSTTTVDQFGDYNQTVKVYLLLGICCGMKFFDHKGQKKCENKTLFLFGLCLGMLALYKQSIGLLAPAAFFVVLLLYCILEKDKGFFRYLCFALIGYLLPLAFCAIWLIKNDALFPFIEQVFKSSAAKGNSTTLLLRFWKNIFKPDCLAIMLCLTTLYCLYKKKAKIGRKNLLVNNYKYLCGILTSIIVFLCFQKWGTYVGKFFTAIVQTNTWEIFFAIIIGCVFVGYVCGHKPDFPNKNCVYSCLIGGICFLAIYIVTNFNGITTSTLFNASGFYNAKEDFTIFTAYIIVGLLFLSFGYYIIKRKTLYSFQYMMMLVGFFLIIYEAGMATGTTGITYITACVGIPLSLCVLFHIKLPHNSLKNMGIIIGCIFLCFFSMVQKYTEPYSWWGWKDPTIERNCQYSIDVPHMEGFRVAQSTKITYEEIYKLITRNSDEDDFVLTFPYMVLFNITTNRMNAPTFVSSYFFDVCPDEYVINDVQIIRKNPPRIFIMNAYSESFWTYNENAFRGGEESGQRKIIEWFENVRDDYSMIGRVNDLEIYCRTDGKPIRYTFFEDDAKNIPPQPEEDSMFSIKKILLTVLQINPDASKHVSNTLFLIVLFISMLLIRFFNGNYFYSSVLISSLLGVFLDINSLYPLIYVICLLLYCACGQKEESILGKIILLCISIMSISVPLSYVVPLQILVLLREVLSVIILCLCMLKIMTNDLQSQKADTKYIIMTIGCLMLFMVSQIFFGTHWWNWYSGINYFSDNESLMFFSVLFLSSWIEGVTILKKFNNKKQKSKELKNEC